MPEVNKVIADNKVTLDARWLLGDDPPPSGRNGLWGGTVFCLAVICGCVWSWPQLSKWWLQRQLAQEVQSTKALEIRIASLLALEQLLPHSCGDLLEAFCCDEHEESTKVAYQIMERYLDRLEQMDIAQRRAILQGLATSLDQVVSRAPESSRWYTAQLAHRLSDTCQLDDHPSARMTAERLQSLLASLVPSSMAEEPEPARMTLSDSTVTTARARLSDNEPTNEQTMDEPREAAVDLDPPVVVDQTAMSRLATNLQPVETTIHAVASPIRETSYSIRSNDAPVESQSDEPPPMTPTPSAYEQPRPLTQPEPAHGPVSGLDKMETGQLVRMLGSIQPRLVDGAFAELQRRGLSREEVELAVELAQGSTRQRLEAIDRMMQTGHRNPIPWLVWMAEDGDTEVRKYAVAALGSMNSLKGQHSDIAAAQLRMLLSRERDQQVEEQIRRALMAFGSNSGMIRR